MKATLGATLWTAWAIIFEEILRVSRRHAAAVLPEQPLVELGGTGDSRVGAEN